MVRVENLPTYYKNTKPYYHRFFKEIFTEDRSFEELKTAVNERITIRNSDFLDSIYLEEAITFLRRSIFNLLAYKYLVCGKHLPMAKVSLYYSYFDSISCLLRIRGVAVVHISEVTTNFEDTPEKLKFTVTQHENHTFSLSNTSQSEHKFVWNEFHRLFPSLSSQNDGRWFTQDRYEWNYGLLYPSQATDEFAQQEITHRCENNFLDPQFENANSSEEAEYRHELVGNYGYEEMYADSLIKEGLKLLILIGKESNHKSKYVESLTKIKNDMDMVESSESTKNEIKKWLDDTIESLER